LIGLTDEVLSELKKQNRNDDKKGPPSTLLYQEILVLNEFKLKPSEWQALHRIDKKALYYFMIMKNYYTDKQYDEIKKKSDQQKNSSDLMAKMPQQNMPYQRGRR